MFFLDSNCQHKGVFTFLTLLFCNRFDIDWMPSQMVAVKSNTLFLASKLVVKRFKKWCHPTRVCYHVHVRAITTGVWPGVILVSPSLFRSPLFLSLLLSLRLTHLGLLSTRSKQRSKRRRKEWSRFTYMFVSCTCLFFRKIWVWDTIKKVRQQHVFHHFEKKNLHLCLF
jgi:hypothetical protein